MVNAMYNLIEYVVHQTGCEYLLFISGEDYPIIPGALYDTYIDCEKNYVQYEKLPKKDWDHGGIDRVQHLYPFRSYTTFRSRAFIKLQKLMKYSRNYGTLGFSLYGGSQWININRTAAEYVLDQWHTFYSVIKYSRIPDELLFQSILLNSPLRETIENNNLRFLHFEKGHDHPVYLDKSYFGKINDAMPLFCRKIQDPATFEAFHRYFNNAEAQNNG
ncbi:core-2/I-Branching enzyme [Paenibacillus methanolicus]|uniref:Peptide O-xylosyltransferase n=2 Tax=Paenibacillus methanolicus TaxID=582686 RepID=A0A5S5BRY3_9BACL|nr:core-2/I-Branching enzyme [Paenibacillus methanolicus]